MEQETYYKISKTQLLDLLRDSIELGMLEADGVDNWSWYGEGRKEYYASLLDITPEEAEEYSAWDVAQKVVEKDYEELLK